MKKRKKEQVLQSGVVNVHGLNYNYKLTGFWSESLKQYINVYLSVECKNDNRAFLSYRTYVINDAIVNDKRAVEDKVIRIATFMIESLI